MFCGVRQKESWRYSTPSAAEPLFFFWNRTVCVLVWFVILHKTGFCLVLSKKGQRGTILTGGNISNFQQEGKFWRLCVFGRWKTHIPHMAWNPCATTDWACFAYGLWCKCAFLGFQKRTFFVKQIPWFMGVSSWKICAICAMCVLCAFFSTPPLCARAHKGDLIFKSTKRTVYIVNINKMQYLMTIYLRNIVI